GIMSAEAARLLSLAVVDRRNILVAGGTSSGKTTLANALLAEMAHLDERVILIEDTRELQSPARDTVALRTRAGSVTMGDLVRSTLRLRPDRIIVGEVRGGEVLELLQAMNTGHDGSMGTIHASSPRECLYRAEMLAGFAGFQGSEVSLRRQIANAVDFIVQIGRLSNGRRRLLSLTEVTGMTDNMISMQELYRYEPQVGPDGQEIDQWVSLGISPHSPKLLSWWRMQQQTGHGGVR
ncbi:MAG: pilus assembly protein CpaF, partial [Delftia sp.]|nr:pilus assembly protein CpaF [Delftia sp.]